MRITLTSFGAVSCASSLLFACAVEAQQIVYVDASLTTGANDGSSWSDAFQGRLGLQAALSSLPTVGEFEIWLADGTYAPAGVDGGRDAHFAMRNDLAILGGFAGGESAKEKRSPQSNVVILTGDLNDNDTPGEIYWGHQLDNATNVVRAFGLDASAVLDGVTVTHGYAGGVGAVNMEGANIRIEGGSPTIRQCRIVAGDASWGGGGAAVMGASPSFEDCVFLANIGPIFGAGVYHTDGSAATFDRCTFDANIGGNGTGVFSGRGAANAIALRDCQFTNNDGRIGAASGIGVFDQDGSPTIERCTFVGNKTDAGGGGVFLQGSTATVRDSVFIDNEGFADGGGAVYAQAMPFASKSGPTLTGLFINCRFVGNNGVIVANQEAHVDFINCSLVHNGLQDQFLLWPVALTQGQGTLVAFRNCLIWGNGGVTFGGGDSLGGTIHRTLNGEVTMDSCCVEHWDNSLAGAGNFEATPMFVDALGTDGIAGTIDDDVHVIAGSPCVDAGDNAFVPASVVTDLDLLARIVDGDGDTIATVDIGAFELQPELCTADLVDSATFLPPGDGIVDGADLAYLLGQWGANVGSPADFVTSATFAPPGDGIVDGADLAVLLGAWGMCGER